MPTLVLHEHPAQRGACLQAMLEYAQRIPLRFSSLEQTAEYLRSLPFEADYGAIVSGDGRCYPAQRQRIWPAAMNCWEATGHFLAHALKLLRGPDEIHVWDRTLRSTGGRHVWPVLFRADGAWLVDLSPSVTQRMGPANDVWNDILGAVHVAGRGALGIFLGGTGNKVADTIEGWWGDKLPEWARATPSQAAPAPSKPAGPTPPAPPAAPPPPPSASPAPPSAPAKSAAPPVAATKETLAPRPSEKPALQSVNQPKGSDPTSGSKRNLMDPSVV